MRYAALILFLACVGRLSAQRTDTVLYKGGAYKYAVCQKDQKGKVIGPYAVYDHAGVLKFKAEAKHGKWNGTWTTFFENGSVLSVGTMQAGKAIGTWVSYDENGRKRRETPFKKGYRDGILKSWFTNGQLEATYPYKKDKLNGECIIWDSTGTLANGDVELKGPFGAELIKTHCVNGRQNGKATSIRFDGCLYSVGNFKNGLAEGAFVYFNSNETPVRKDLYKDGRFVSSEYLNIN